MPHTLPKPRPIKRIVLMIEEGHIFSRHYLPEILHRLSPSIVSVASVKPKHKHQKRHNIAHMLPAIGFTSMVTLAFKKIASVIMTQIPNKLRPHSYKRLKSLAQDYHIPYITLGSLNTKRVHTWLKAQNPDIVISSVSEILHSDILSIPKMGFVNKHAAILPSYRGLMPVVHALSRGEKTIGMTIHTMTTHIDDGIILSQRAYSVRQRETVFSAYRRVYAELPDQIEEAISVLEGKMKPVTVDPQPKESYYSTPTASVWKALKQQGHRLA